MDTLHLKRNRHKRINEGHLWAFAGEIAEDIKQFTPGDSVALCDSRGKLLGRGYINPHSLIAVRLITRAEESWDKNTIKNRIISAIKFREQNCRGWEARRLFYSESDGIPGLIVDQYSQHLVLQSLTAGIERRLDEIKNALVEIVKPASIYLNCNSSYRTMEGLERNSKPLYGTIPEDVTFKEENISYTARLQKGQKTGFYLDQRSNRNMLRGLAEGRRILDLYCFTGSWGIRALSEGAASAVMVDSSSRAIDWGKEDAERNKNQSGAVFVKADAGDFLDDAIKNKDAYDVVILDPPALIKSRKNLEKGIAAYRAINRKALQVTAPGGYLISCSCSHLMDRPRLLTLIGEVSRKLGRHVRLVETGGHSIDHPILPGHPETEYLKCLLFQCD